MTLGIGVFALLLFGVIIILVIWLTKSRDRAIKAETISVALIKGNERSHEANKVMAEPIADESAWLRRAYDRLRDNSSSS